MKTLLLKGRQIFDLVDQYLLTPTPIIVEAGAFNGADTLAMAKRWPHAAIHAFEPIPQLYRKLSNNTHMFSNVFCYQLALSNKDGQALFYVSEHPKKQGVISQAGSLLSPKKRLDYSSIRFPYTINVPTITLDSWVTQHNVSTIDFMWLDIQGHELAVLKAFRLLEIVKMIYLEVGFLENYEGQPTYDVIITWLSKKGFHEIGRDFNNTHDWIFGNILFAR